MSRPEECPDRVPATPPVSSGKGCQNDCCCDNVSRESEVPTLDVPATVQTRINALRQYRIIT